MSDSERIQADVLDRWWDSYVDRKPAPVPNGQSDLTHLIRRLHEGTTVVHADSVLSDRLWQRVHAAAAAPPTSAPARWRLARMRLAPLAAVLLAVVLLGFAIASSATVQAQARRLGCRIPVFGIQDCNGLGLVATQPVSVTQGDLTLSVLYLVSSTQQTSLRMEVRGLPADLSSGRSPLDDPQLGPEQRAALQSTRVALRTDLGETLEAEPIASSDPNGAATYATLRALHAVDQSVTAPRLTTEIEWTLPPLNTATRSVEIIATGLYSWSVRVAVVPLQQAGLVSATENGPAITRDGISAWVDGVSRDAGGLLHVQLAGRASGGQLVGFGEVEPDSGVFGRALWDDSGQPYFDDARRCCPITDHTTGDTYFQELTFPNVPDGTRLRMLEVPYVMVRQQLPPAVLTIDLAGHAGEPIPLDTDLRIGHDVLRVVSASVTPDGALLLELDFGDWPNGRRLGLPLMISVNGQPIDPRSVRTVTSDLGNRRGFARQLTERVPLPEPAQSQLTLTISSPGVTYRGPWLLPLPATGLDAEL